MPTYEYECLQCGHEFELFQKMTDPPRKRCPQCRGAVRRKVGAGAGIIFKGSGFYQTDYRSEEYRKKAKAESSAHAGAGAKAESSAHAGTEAKAESSAHAGTEAKAKDGAKEAGTGKAQVSGSKEKSSGSKKE